jgi:plastocyanin
LRRIDASDRARRRQFQNLRLNSATCGNVRSFTTGVAPRAADIAAPVALASSCAGWAKQLHRDLRGRLMRPLLIALLVLLGSVSRVLAGEVALTIKNHRFEPAELEVPAGQSFTLNVSNQDASPEEFESDDLDIEKVIPGGRSAVIKVGPLDAGRYEFYGEYHEDSARGVIVAK